MALRLHQATAQLRAQKLRLYEASGKAATTGQRFRIHTVGSKWTAPVVAPTISVTIASAPLAYEPGVTVTLTGVSADSPDGWAWDQISGPDVGLTGRDSQIATYVAPPYVDVTQVSFRVTAFKGVSTPAQATVTHTIYPHTLWTRDDDGSLSPVQVFIGV